jgi:hypothetical protein
MLPEHKNAIVHGGAGTIGGVVAPPQPTSRRTWRKRA